MGAGAIMVSRAIADSGHPEVTLMHGVEFYYFLFDNGSLRASSECLVYETEIVKGPRFDAVPVDRLILDGIEFAKRIKSASD